MNTEKVDQLLAYVQERCLWQFVSRTKDRHENLDGNFLCANDMLTGKAPARETPMERLFYADAKVMVQDFKERFPWLESCGAAQIREMMQGVKDKLTDIAITSSLNHELNHTLY